MSREAIVALLTEIAFDAVKHGYPGIASMLFLLCATIIARCETELAEHCHDFVEREVGNL